VLWLLALAEGLVILALARESEALGRRVTQLRGLLQARTEGDTAQTDLSQDPSHEPGGGRQPRLGKTAG